MTEHNSQRAVEQFRKWLTSLTALDESLSKMTTALRGPTLNCWGPLRLPGAFQIVEGPSDCRGPVRLMKAPQIAGTPILLGAPQIAGDPSDCWGPLWLIGPLRLSGALQIARNPSDCCGPFGLLVPLRLLGASQIDGGPSDGWWPLCIAQPAQPIATPLLLPLEIALCSLSDYLRI